MGFQTSDYAAAARNMAGSGGFQTGCAVRRSAAARP